MNRVFSLRFKPNDENVLISGGWDDNVRIWDVRTPDECSGIMFGPHICGDGIDIAEDDVVTASWRQKDPLEVQ